MNRRMLGALAGTTAALTAIAGGGSAAANPATGKSVAATTVVDAAAKAFSDGGYHAVRLDDIADAVGSGAADLAEATTRVHLHHAFHHLTRRGRAEETPTLLTPTEGDRP